MKTVMPVSSVATALGKSPKTIHRWCANGTIPAVRIGGSWFVLEYELDELLTARPRQ